MSLPKFSDDVMSKLVAELNRRDKDSLKRGRDIEMDQGRIILTSPNGTRYALVVDNAGALSTVAA